MLYINMNTVASNCAIINNELHSTIFNMPFVVSQQIEINISKCTVMAYCCLAAHVYRLLNIVY